MNQKLILKGLTKYFTERKQNVSEVIHLTKNRVPTFLHKGVLAFN